MVRSRWSARRAGHRAEEPSLAGEQGPLTRQVRLTIVRRMNGFFPICGICREIVG